MHTNLTITPAQSKEARAALTMSQTGRWAAISGIGFVLLMVVGSMLVGDVPRPDAPVQEITDYLADSDRHLRNIIGAYAWLVGALAFLFFLTRLRNELRAAEGGTGTLSSLVFGAGVAFSAVWTVSAAAFTSVAYAVTLHGAPVSEPDLVRVLPALGRLLLLHGGGFTGLLLLVAASLVIVRTGVFPRWLGWLGIVAATALPFDVIYSNILPFWGWVFIASVVILVRRRTSTAAPTPGPTSLPRPASVA